MPAPAHRRITFSGVFGTASAPVEVWNFGLSYRANLPVGGADPVAATGTEMTALQNAYSTHLRPLMGTDVILTRIRCAQVDQTGHVARLSTGGYAQTDLSSTLAGTVAFTPAKIKPLQTALCVSLLTARAGAAGKGRFFLPWPVGLELGYDYRLSTNDTDTVATAAKGFLNAVKAVWNSDLVVGSSGSTKTGAGPVLSTVTGVRVGRAPDTMRSRRGGLIEGYSTQAL